MEVKEAVKELIRDHVKVENNLKLEVISQQLIGLGDHSHWLALLVQPLLQTAVPVSKGQMKSKDRLVMEALTQTLTMQDKNYRRNLNCLLRMMMEKKELSWTSNHSKIGVIKNNIINPQIPKQETI